METLQRELHGYKVLFTATSKAYRSSLNALKNSYGLEAESIKQIEQDIKDYKKQAEYFRERINEVKEQLKKEWKKSAKKRKAVDPILMSEFYNLKNCFFDCKRCGKDYKHFNLISSSEITEEEYKTLHSIKDFADLMRAFKIMAENKINK